MKKNILSSLFGCGVILISLFLLVGCQPEETAAAALPASAAAAAQENDGFDYATAADNQAARWQAMGAFYEANDMLNFSYTQAAELHAARWQAMADYYARNGLLNETAVAETDE